MSTWSQSILTNSVSLLIFVNPTNSVNKQSGHSLNSILFLLWTGSAPFNSKRLEKATVAADLGTQAFWWKISLDNEFFYLSFQGCLLSMMPADKRKGVTWLTFVREKNRKVGQNTFGC